MKQWIEAFLRRRFIKFCGEGAPHQADVYRCVNCGSLITWKAINVGEVCCSGRITPTNPKWHEKLRLVLVPWSF